MENKLVDYIRSAVDRDDEPFQTLLTLTETGYPAFADVLKHPVSAVLCCSSPLHFRPGCELLSYFAYGLCFECR